MIELVELSKRFGSLYAVDGLSLSIQRGEVLGFLGPNGAGKSTTMKMITGFLSPSRGTVTVCGKDVVSQTRAAQQNMGYLPEGAPLYPDMTPRSLLAFCAAARGLTGSASQQAIGLAVERTELAEVINQRIETLSKGFKRRVGLAQAILHDPPVLVLDEPTDGLDPNQKAQVRSLIREMSADKVVVLSTHILEEVEAVCTRATIMAEGRLRFDGTPVELRQRSRFYSSIELHLVGNPQDAVHALESIPGVDSVQTLEAREGQTAVRIFPNAKQALLGQVTALVSERGWQVAHLFVDPGRLDDVFRVLTRSGSSEERQNTSFDPTPASGSSTTPEQLTSQS